MYKLSAARRIGIERRLCTIVSAARRVGIGADRVKRATKQQQY